MKILLGLDLSRHADAALNYVLRMAWAQDTTFVVVSVVHLPFMAYGESAAFAPDDVAGGIEAISQAHGAAATRAARRLKDAGWPAEARVVQGDPREALLDEAVKNHADLLVVGSHGRTRLARVLMGSVAAHVVVHAPCSVLVVKPEARSA